MVSLAAVLLTVLAAVLFMKAAWLPGLILAAGLPALYAGPALALVAAADREVGVARSAKGVAGVVMALALLLLHSGPFGFAAALAARHWAGTLALGAMHLLGRKVEQGGDSSALDQQAYRPYWRHIAAETRLTGQQRLAYRLAKILLSGFLGPVGSVIARTLRGTRQFARIRLTGFVAAIVLAIVSAVAISIAILLLSDREHVVRLVLATSMIKLACAATGTLIWVAASLGTPSPSRLGDDDDDDE